jgi:hypothetical protein
MIHLLIKGQTASSHQAIEYLSRNTPSETHEPLGGIIYIDFFRFLEWSFRKFGVNLLGHY